MKPEPKKKNYINQPLVDEIGRRIRECRKAQKKSILTLASECSVDASEITRMEKGKVNVSVSMLHKIATGLKVNYKELQPD